MILAEGPPAMGITMDMGRDMDTAMDTAMVMDMAMDRHMDTDTMEMMKKTEKGCLS